VRLLCWHPDRVLRSSRPAADPAVAGPAVAGPADRAADPLELLRDEIRSCRIGGDTCHRLRLTPPDPRRFRALLDEVLPHCPTSARLVLAELALHLVGRDRGFREAATVLVGGLHGDPDPACVRRLCDAGSALRADGDLLWWHGLFRSVIRDDPSYHELVLTRHHGLLLHHDLPNVLDYLLEPDRGPARGNLRSFRYVIDERNGCRPLERRWTEWIRTGEFDLRWPECGAFELGVELKHGLRRRPAVFEPLLVEALGRWRALLRSPDAGHRAQAVHDILTLAQHEILLDGRVLREVVPAADHELLPEITEVTAVCTEVEYAALYGNRPRQLRATGKAAALRERLAERARGMI
jgi:hypothetical protein